MIAAAATNGRSRKASRFVIGVMLILTCALMGACSTAPDGADAAKTAGLEAAHLRLARVEQPAGEPGSVMRGALSLEDQRTILQVYRDALYAALTAAVTGSRPAADCEKCPILTSRILAINEDLAGIPSKTELTVLFSLADPGRGNDASWSKVIKKTGQSYNLAGVLRVKSAREAAVTEVLRELVTVLPSDVRPPS